MTEKIIKIQKVDVSKLFGVDNQKIDRLGYLFPEIKLIARGTMLKIRGDKKNINSFERKFSMIIQHLEKYNSLTINQIEDIITEGETVVDNEKTIVYGVGGKSISAKTKNQNKILLKIQENDMVFVIGPAGTGKTYTSVAIAVKFLKEKRVKRIILTRPAIEAGENLGFLPGDLKEKIDPYMQPIYDAFSEMLSIEKLKNFIDKGIIQIAPLAFMRGRTLDNAFVILDEGQNTTDKQMKMFLTRMGVSSKFIITGDETQIDLPKNSKSGLLESKKLLKKIKEISFVSLNEKDVIRHKIVKKIINAYKK